MTKKKPRNGLYQKKYGDWAGNPAGQAPDHERCCVEVWSNDRFSRGSQCRRKRGHGPEGAYCAQHDPDVVRERKRRAAARFNTAWEQRRYEIYGKSFYDVLTKIAAGANNPRGLAQKTVRVFKRKRNEV